jgi:uncharacterized membrane protein YjjP (DUF1212 family)
MHDASLCYSILLHGTAFTFLNTGNWRYLISVFVSLYLMTFQFVSTNVGLPGRFNEIQTLFFSSLFWLWLGKENKTTKGIG